MAQSRVDVLVNVLAILRQRCAFSPLALNKLEPILRGPKHRNAFARCRVDTRLYFRLDPNLVRVSVLLSGKGLDAVNAVTVQILDNPSFFLLAFPSNPLPLAYRHNALPVCMS